MSVEDYGLPTTPALGLVNLCFVPHMNSEYFKFSKVDLENMKGQFAISTYAVDDETALSIDGDNVKMIGLGNSFACIV